MAIVRITKKLLEQVEGHIKEMSRMAAASGYMKNEPVTNPEVVAALVERAHVKWFSDKPELRGAIPESWLAPTERIDFNIKIESGGHLRMSVPGKFYVPNDAKPGYGGVSVVVNTCNLPPETGAALLEHYTANKAHEDKFTTVRQQVKSFLEASKSLNDAVKRFPNIALYIPKVFIDQMNAKAVAKETEKAEAVELDTTLLSVVGASHLMGS